MRLIDADDLKKTYYRELNIEPGETGACYIAFGMFPRTIDKAPTIEPKRGRWIDREERDGGSFVWRYECSACGKKSILETRYCPNCGAKMDGEDA